MLAFDQIRWAIERIQEKNKTHIKNIHYATVTNGSLIDDPILHFFCENKFFVLLSFDGILQDVSRKGGSSEKTVEIIGRILEHKDIHLEICNVFTPETVSLLSKSLRSIIELGVQNIDFSLSTLQPWSDDSLYRFKEELILLREMLITYHRESGVIPVMSFRKSSAQGIFCCLAGENRMALTPEGKLWGCYLFPDLFKEKENTDAYKKYCFGDLDTFITDYDNIFPEISMNYSTLRMDRFSVSNTACRDCSELFECVVCPMDAALSGFPIGRIPSWTCQIKRILREERKIFWEELEDRH